MAGKMFQVGGPGGPGRPNRQTEAGYLQTMMQVCNLDSWREICERATAEAKQGDPKAREWLSRYLVGAPETAAPRPLEIIVGDLLMRDEALEVATERLVKPQISRALFPILGEDLAEEDRLRDQARAAILKANG